MRPDGRRHTLRDLYHEDTYYDFLHRKWRWALISGVLIVFVIMLGFGIIAPILPLYARSFGVSYDAASLLISAFVFAASDPFSPSFVISVPNIAWNDR